MSISRNETAAFIGFGFSGLAEFCSYVDEAIAEKQTPKIIIFEKNGHHPATGLPYSPSNPVVWNLNGPSADKLCMPVGGKPLKDWMEENRSLWQSQFGVIDEKYPPRALVGLYLENQFYLYKQKAR